MRDENVMVGTTRPRSLQVLVDYSRRIAATAARSKKIQLLAESLRSLNPNEVALAVAYLSGELRQGKIGLGYATLRQAQQESAAVDAQLSLSELDAALEQIAAIRGAGSTQGRAQRLRALFQQLTTEESDFVVRLIVGELRQGALSGIMVDAIAAAASIPAHAVRRAAMYAPSLGVLAEAAMREGSAGLSRFQLQVMAPIAPMLAQTATSVAEAFATLRVPIAFDWKMDGARIQVHKRGEDIRIYTRSLNDVTHAIPEIAAAIKRLPARELILDGEAIAYTQEGRPHSFQTSMRRFGRKLEVETLQLELPMRAFFFDCLHLNDRSVADLPAHERFEALNSAVPAEMLIPRIVTADPAAAESFYEDALRAGHEGLMAKDLQSPYEAGNRGASWLKIKRAHTLDLVVLAAEWGHGRRTGWLSNLHLGARDAATGEYVMLGKTFKGLTDAMLQWQTGELLAREVRRDEWAVYVRPELVVEIAFSDLQVSRRYPGGLALRLARVKRYRTDKRADEADSMETVRKIFAAQG